MTSLGDLPDFNNKFKQPSQDADYDFGGFDDFGEDDSQNKNEESRYSNAEKYLDDFENEEKEGFKVEVNRPRKKTAPVSSGKKNLGKKNKFGKGYQDNNDEEIIEEDIVTDREKENNYLGNDI